MEKRCIRCKEAKDISRYEFYKNRLTYANKCKDCKNAEDRERRANNKEKYRQMDRDSYEKNKEKILKKQREWQRSNKDNMAEAQRRWREKNPEKANSYYKPHPRPKMSEEERKERARERARAAYVPKPRVLLTDEEKIERRRALGRTEKARAAKRERHKRRKREDPSYRMKCNISNKIRSCFRSGHGVFTRLGYSREDLRQHLERQFTDGMSWSNYGEWHIDHIKPQSLFDFTKERDVIDCWSLSNLQPLWGIENIMKSNKY